MASIFDRIDKRQAFPVDGFDGVFVCEPTFGQIDRISGAATPNEKNAMALALCVVDATGNPVFPQNAGESDADFLARAVVAAADTRPSFMKAVQAAIGKLLKTQEPDELAKN